MPQAGSCLNNETYPIGHLIDHITIIHISNLSLLNEKNIYCKQHYSSPMLLAPVVGLVNNFPCQKDCSKHCQSESAQGNYTTIADSIE